MSAILSRRTSSMDCLVSCVGCRVFGKMRQFASQLVRFLMVGGVSFLVDAGVLWLLVYRFDVGYIPGRLVSVLLAISVAFVLNAKFTFLVRVADARFSRYVAIQALGATMNFSVYTVLVLAGPLAGRPLFSLMCGAAVATVNNFLFSRKFVYIPR